MTEKLLELHAPRIKANKRNIQLVAVTIASAPKTISNCVRNRKVRIRAELATAADTVDFIFSKVNTDVVDNTLTGDQDGEASAQLGFRLLHGESLDFMLNGDDNFIIVRGTSAGALRIVGRGRKVQSGQTDEGP